LQALITGITGQDGAYLALHLLNLGYYRVIGLVRRTSDDNPVNHIRLPELRSYIESEQLVLEYGDVTDLHSLVRILREHSKISEVYNLAAQSHVAISFDTQLSTLAINGVGPLNVLEAIRTVNPDIKLYQASTSEMFGDAAVQFQPQDEQTPFLPNSPYGCAKAYAHRMLVNARHSHGHRIACGILYNHESEIRGENFVTRKITLSVAKISLHRQEMLELGNMDAERDWGYAPDYVIAMQAMLRQAEPPRTWQDYVIATGVKHSVRDFVTAAFVAAYEGKVDLLWLGEEDKTELVVDGVVRVQVNPLFYRPKDLNSLCGNPAKAIQDLGWNPRRTPFGVMVQRMVEHDLKQVRAAA